MNSWLMYWRPDTDRPDPLDRAASNQFDKIEPGDEVWFVTTEDNELILFGHILVGKRLTENEALATIGKGQWEAKYHIIPQEKPEPRVHIPIAHLAPALRFQGGVTQLPRDFSGQHLQAIRNLTPESAAMLQSVWTSKDR